MDEYTIKIDIYPAKITESLFDLQRRNILCDTIVHTKEGQVHVHGVVLLASNCHLFTNLNFCNSLVSSTSYMHIHHFVDVRMEVVRCIVELLYTGCVRVSPGLVPDLLKVCEILHLEEISDSLSKTVTDLYISCENTSATQNINLEQREKTDNSCSLESPLLANTGFPTSETVCHDTLTSVEIFDDQISVSQTIQENVPRLSTEATVDVLIKKDDRGVVNEIENKLVVLNSTADCIAEESNTQKDENKDKITFLESFENKGVEAEKEVNEIQDMELSCVEKFSNDCHDDIGNENKIEKSQIFGDKEKKRPLTRSCNEHLSKLEHNIQQKNRRKKRKGARFTKVKKRKETIKNPKSQTVCETVIHVHRTEEKKEIPVAGIVEDQGSSKNDTSYKAKKSIKCNLDVLSERVLTGDVNDLKDRVSDKKNESHVMKEQKMTSKKLKLTKALKGYEKYGQESDKRTQMRTANVCFICDENMLSAAGLRKHNETTHPETVGCPKCHIVMDKSELNSHYRKSHLKCEQCDYKFPPEAEIRDKETKLAEHYLKKHDTIYNQKRFPIVKCDVDSCSFTSVIHNKITQHKKMVHEPGQHTCEFCGKICCSQSNLRLHKEAVHATVRRQFNWQCQLCPKKFASKGHLNGHMKFHNKELLCHLCSKCCSTRTDLAVHMYTQHKVVSPNLRLHRCEKCDYKSYSSWAFKNHVASKHGGTKDFVCHDCGKQFYCGQNLRSHLKLHKGTKYQCPVEGCSFMTIYKSALHRKHIPTVHTDKDVKNSLCHLCDYRCKNNHTLKTHIRIKHKLNISGTEIKQIQERLQGGATWPVTMEMEEDDVMESQDKCDTSSVEFLHPAVNNVQFQVHYQ